MSGYGGVPIGVHRNPVSFVEALRQSPVLASVGVSHLKRQA